MIILFLTRRFYPQIGGVEKHVLEISKRLVAKGHKVTVIAELEKNTNASDEHSTPGSATITGKVDGIDIFRIDPGKNNWFKKFRIWWQLWKLIRLIGASDVVHCHDIFFWYLPFRLIFPFKKVYTTFHGYEGNAIPTKKAILMHKLAETLSFGNICIGKFLEKWYGTKATYISYGAVDVSDKKSQNTIDRNLIVFLGRLEKETGIMEYLEAFNKLSKLKGNLALEVLGNGALMGKATEYARDNDLPVHFRGFTTDTAKYLERASFVFVSRYLGMLETMVSKKYVLAVYNNKIKEDYLRMTPFAKYISICADSNEVYNELKKWLSAGKQKDTKVSNAYNWVKTETWEKMTDLYLKLWKLS